jgi:hypothetical protein
MRACVATAVVALSVALPLLGGPADAQQVHARQVAQPTRGPLALTVTSVSPSYAGQGRTVTIAGRVRNLSAAAATGLSVQLWSSKTQLPSRHYLENYASGSYLPRIQPVPVAPVTLPQLDAGRSWTWKVKLPASDLGLSCFGVYPLTVQVKDASYDVASVPVPLPYWPARANSCASQHRPQPFPISWIWPLIDVPHQAMCAGLIDNRLAPSIAPDGRLGYLLAVGSRYSARAKLTWAIDPSLLDSAAAMRHSYPVGASARCRPAAELPASPAASRWLASLVKATAGQPVFLTPYSDVDVAALARHGSQSSPSDLDRAFAEAAQVGRRILHRTAPVPIPAGAHELSAIGWPASGIASRPVLDSFATEHVRTVILAAPALSPVNYTPGAVASTLTGIGKPLRVLLADHPITALLGSKESTSATAGSIFGTSQLYLAETAMIVSQAPASRRPIVVAPPRRWDPPRQLASNLLAETASAPWLEPSTAGQLVTMPREHVYPRLTQSAPGAELPGRLLSRVSKLDHRIALLESIRVHPDPDLYRAVLGIESSAWRGKGIKHAQALLGRLNRYVNDQFNGISIRGVSSNGGTRHAAYHVTFGGKTAQVNVLIHNSLRYWVRVGLLVQANQATVSGQPKPIVIPPESYSTPVTLKVHVEAKHGTLRLSLIAPNGSPRHPRPLPAYPLVIIVHPTNFGTYALVIFAIALGVFVTASAFRAIRNGRPGPPLAADSGPANPATPTAGDSARSATPNEGIRSAIADDRTRPASPDDRTRPASPDEQTRPASPDECVRSTASGDRAVPVRSPSGWISPLDLPNSATRDDAIAWGGFPDPGNWPEYTDSVGGDGAEVASASPSVFDQESASPSRRATEEPR